MQSNNLPKLNEMEYYQDTWVKGKVVKKYTEGDKHLVDLHISLEDHNGDLMIPNGSATVSLPSRHMEDWRP